MMNFPWYLLLRNSDELKMTNSFEVPVVCILLAKTYSKDLMSNEFLRKPVQIYLL